MENKLEAETQPPAKKLGPLTTDQQKLVRRHLSLVGMHLKNRVPTPFNPKRHREYEDLFQEGCLGLLRAAARYRPERDGLFAPYALQRIRGAVHTAIHDRFTIVRLPARARQEAKESKQHGFAFPPVRPFEPVTLLDKSPYPGIAPPGDTIRHLLRQRFERAIRLALLRFQSAPQATPQRNAAMLAVATHRLLVSCEKERMPLRRLADQYAISSGRACDYEHRLLNAARVIFANDVHVLMLMHFAASEPHRFDTILDDTQLRQIHDADLNAFERRFTHLDRHHRAELLYHLLEACRVPIPEIARNLYHLATQSTDPLPLAM